MPTDRFKDVNWKFRKTENGSIESYQQVQCAILMDIRDELKRLNQLLHCPNFMGIPTTLRGIQRKLPARPKKGAS